MSVQCSWFRITGILRWDSGSTIYNDCQLSMREMIQKKIRMLGVLSAMLCCGAVSAQQHEVELIPFGDMDQWIDRQIKESWYYRWCHEGCVCHRAYCYYH